MIQKVIKIICDNCGQGIYDFVDEQGVLSNILTYREIVNRCKEQNIATIRYKVGSRIPLTFCDEKCYKEWEDKNDTRYQK